MNKEQNDIFSPHKGSVPDRYVYFSASPTVTLAINIYTNKNMTLWSFRSTKYILKDGLYNENPKVFLKRTLKKLGFLIFSVTY